LIFSELVQKEIVFELKKKLPKGRIVLHIIPTYGKSYTLDPVSLSDNVYRAVVHFNPFKDGKIHYKVSIMDDQDQKINDPNDEKYLKNGLGSIIFQTQQQQLLRFSYWYNDGSGEVRLYVHSKLKGQGSFSLFDKTGFLGSSSTIIDQYSQRFLEFRVNEEKYLNAQAIYLCFQDAGTTRWIDSEYYFNNSEDEALDLKAGLPIRSSARKKCFIQLRSFTDLEYLFNSDLAAHTDGVILPPVFMAASEHGYDTIDFTRTSKGLTDWNDYQQIIERLKAYGMEVIQDVNFNYGHATNPLSISPNFLHSPIRHWSSSSNLIEYDFSRKEVRDYFHNITNQFIENYKIDAFRMDSGNEIPKDFYLQYPERFIYETWDYASPELNYLGVRNLNYTYCSFFNSFKENALSIYRIICETLSNHFFCDFGLNISYISSHDTSSFYDMFGEGDYLKALALLAYMPGDSVLMIDELKKVKSKEIMHALISQMRSLNSTQLPGLILNENGILEISANGSKTYIDLSSLSALQSLRGMSGQVESDYVIFRP
jgi:hypothetical protein